MLVDVGLTTAGLYGAGGLAAAPFIGIYAIVPVYTAIAFSSLACVLTVSFATALYLVVAGLQTAGVLPILTTPAPGAWTIAAFNLLVLNIVGGMAAMLAHAYRASRDRLALYVELERAHDHSVQMNRQLQLATRRYVLSEVVAGVTHEVRDAIQGVFGHLWLARRCRRRRWSTWPTPNTRARTPCASCPPRSTWRSPPSPSASRSRWARPYGAWPR